MKRIINKTLIIALFVGIFSSCTLDEYNPAVVEMETAYKYKDGFEGLLNACYVDLYFFYGKMDGIAPMEMGTDLWTNVSNNEAGYILYNSSLNTTTGSLNVLWQGLYSTINLANTVMYYASEVEEFTEEERDAKIAEARFLRGWAYFHLVEQFGNVVLREKCLIETGPETTPSRAEETDIYDLLISDLEYACEYLPLNQAEKGRASKKAAYAMLSKAALQRTRLGEVEKYSKMALDAAEEIIENQENYGCALYLSDDEKSGFEKLWDGANNKSNTEFLFLETVDHETALNPEGWNRGRTRQYYQADLKTVGASWGTTEKTLVYGRANSRYFKPTKYLLTSVFEPKEDTPDLRFVNSFVTKYYSSGIALITKDMVDKFDKDPSLEGGLIMTSVAKGSEPDVKEANFYASIGWHDSKNFEGFRNLDKSLSIFTPNWNIPESEKALMPYLVNDPSDMFDAAGNYLQDAQRKEIYPSMKKYSNLYYAYHEQYHMGDFPIIRLGEIYLVAAEAALLYNNDKAKAAKYVNEIRKRAAVKSRENEMIVSDSEMSIDFVLEERARELAGEQLRWYDLKRTGKLTPDYLSSKNPDITEFDPAKHTKRPIPLRFLNAISNADEFGTNGY
ncbi:MAG: RagB/SusD family nutrient uptake outer membrane protein [Prolixibacteraceae bacterium]|jgi:hypothetical protein|nr:RagB/SusD family nutrient uptake outer membrane protein [Prolixibacteraceae bacterium]